MQQYVTVKDVVVGASFLTNDGQIRLVKRVDIPNPSENVWKDRMEDTTTVHYLITKDTNQVGPRSYRAGTLHSLKMRAFRDSARVKIRNVPGGVEEAFLVLALSNIIRKFTFGCGSARCTVKRSKGLAVDFDCQCTPNMTTLQLTEALQEWLKSTQSTSRAWIGPGSALVSDVWIPYLSTRLDAGSQKYYGAEFFVCETIQPVAAKALCAAFGIEFLNAPPGGKTLVQVFAEEEELNQIKRKRVSNADTSPTPKS